MSALSATLGNVDISQAYIGTLTVGTSNIDPGAITEVETGSTSVTITHGLGSPKLRVDFSFLVSFHPTVTNPSVSVTLTDNDGVVIPPFFVSGNNSTSVPVSLSRVVIPPSGRTQTTFTLNISENSNTVTQQNIIASAFKR